MLRPRRLLGAALALLVLSATGFSAASASTSAGPVGGKYRSYAYLAISRAGAAVYVNALVHQDSGHGLAASPNRTVYLQRQLPGGWQNVLARHTDARGRFTVGYLSAPSYPYRLIVLADATTWNATSATVLSPLLGGVLHSGKSLVAGSSGDTLNSPSGFFTLQVQAGGHYCLEQTGRFPAIPAIVTSNVWSITTTLTSVPSTDHTRLTMQTNGNLLMSSAAGTPLWASHSYGPGSSLYLQNDGNMVIYNTASRVVWASGTTQTLLIAGTVIPSGKRYLYNEFPQFNHGIVGGMEMRRDGNLVLFGRSTVVWSTNTHVPGSHAAFTSNGTLAVYSPSGTVLWRSANYGPYSYVQVQCGLLFIHPRYGSPQYLPSAELPASCRD